MSKGLEELVNRDYLDDEGKQIYDNIKKELKELEVRRKMMRRFNEACVPMILDNETEKKLKALEIIKIKKVNVFSLYTSFRTQELWGYNNGTLVRENKLKQEEYDLLKEVLSND